MKIIDSTLHTFPTPEQAVGRICCVDLRYYLIIDDCGVYRSVDLETGQVHSTPRHDQQINWLLDLVKDPSVVWYDQLELR